MNALRLLQHRDADGNRSVIADDGHSARIIEGVASTRELALRAIEAGVGLAEMVQRCGLGVEVDTLAEMAAGRIIAPIDMPIPFSVGHHCCPRFPPFELSEVQRLDIARL